MILRWIKNKLFNELFFIYFGLSLFALLFPVIVFTNEYFIYQIFICFTLKYTKDPASRGAGAQNVTVKPTGCGFDPTRGDEICIFPFLRSGVEDKGGIDFCHSTRKVSRIRQKVSDYNKNLVYRYNIYVTSKVNIKSWNNMTDFPLHHFWVKHSGTSTS